MAATDISARVAKAFRVRGTRVRGLYFNARRVSRFLRDGKRRAIIRALPSSVFQIPWDAGFLLLPASTFQETPALVGQARATLAPFDAADPHDGKNRKRFLLNVLDQSELTLESPIVRLALRDDVLAAVSRYLGIVPFLSSVAVFHSDAIESAPATAMT